MGILEDRRKRMGLPSGVGQLNQTATATPNKFKALEDIKRGAKRAEFNTFKEKARGSNQQEGYQIPTAKKRVDPNAPKSKSAIAVTGAPMKTSNEASSLESMLFDDVPARMSTSDTGTVGTISDIAGPSYNPESVLAAKQAAQERLSTTAPMHESITPPEEVTYNMTQMKSIMETIAKRVSEDTMKAVISEFVEKNKKQNIYEVYNKKQNVVKIKGKLYKLTPVTLKS